MIKGVHFDLEFTIAILALIHDLRHLSLWHGHLPFLLSPPPTVCRVAYELYLRFGTPLLHEREYDLTMGGITDESGNRMLTSTHRLAPLDHTVSALVKYNFNGFLPHQPRKDVWMSGNAGDMGGASVCHSGRVAMLFSLSSMNASSYLNVYMIYVLSVCKYFFGASRILFCVSLTEIRYI